MASPGRPGTERHDTKGFAFMLCLYVTVRLLETQNLGFTQDHET